MLVLNNVSVAKGDRKVLSNFSLQVDPGELVCVVGKSGTGKSTLIELLTGLRSPDSGTVEVDGMDLRVVPPEALQLYRRRLGVVFEGGKLLPGRTVWENVAFPLQIIGASELATDKRVREVLRAVDLKGREEEMPEHLTPDERIRVAVARAIAHKPLIVLADEPLAMLDATEAAEVKDLLRRVHGGGATVVMFTHNLEHATDLGGRIVNMDGTSPAPVMTKRKQAQAEEKHHDFFSEDGPPIHEMEAPVAAAPAPVTEPAKETPLAVTEETPPVRKKKGKAVSAGEPVKIDLSEPAAEESPKKRHIPVRKTHDEGGGGRKIRVTSIHSD